MFNNHPILRAMYQNSLGRKNPDNHFKEDVTQSQTNKMADNCQKIL